MEIKNEPSTKTANDQSFTISSAPRPSEPTIDWPACARLGGVWGSAKLNSASTAWADAAISIGVDVDSTYRAPTNNPATIQPIVPHTRTFENSCAGFAKWWSEIELVSDNVGMNVRK